MSGFPPSGGSREDFLREVLASHPQACYAGVGVVVRELLGRIDFVKVLDELLEWDPAQCKLSPGTRILALVSAFVENRRALFRMPEIFAEKDLEVFLGAGVKAEWLNDKALARALDKLADADARRVYSTICFRAVEAYHAVIERLHMDTTSVSVYGAYEGEPHFEGPFAITYGYSKDRRPDLKQFKLGAVVTQEGLPLAGDVMSGNETDQTWDRKLLPWLSSWLAEDRRHETFLVADSSLVTEENLKRLRAEGYTFVSRLPNTFGIVNVAKAKALFQGKNETWTEVGALSEKKDAASYRLFETTGEIGGETYRLIVVHSSKLSSRKARSLDREAQREKDGLDKRARALMRETFRCEEDATGAFEAFLEQEDPLFHDVTHLVARETVTPARRRRGRPAKDDTPPTEEAVFRLIVTVGERKEETLASERRWESTFVLITNDRTRNPKEIFRAYRGQAAVESAFKWLKAPVRLSPVFLKNPGRIEAFGYVAMMAYLVHALIQKLVRDALPAGELLAIEGRKTAHPTGQAVLDLLGHIQVLVFRPPGQKPFRLFTTSSSKVQRVLELLGVPADAFLTIPALNSG